MDKRREMFEDWFEREYVNHNFGYSKLDMFAAWQAALASQWQPIETAPKDGERILGWCQVEADVVYWRRVNGEHRWMSDAAVDFGGYETPTHWMPLPSEPTE